MIDKTVLVIGCGGLGGFVGEELTRIGVKNLVLVDGDVFVESNMNRQLESAFDTLGQFKAEVMRSRLTQKGRVNVTAKTMFFTEETEDIVASVDLVMDCVDNVKTRLFIEKVCEKHKKILVHGGVEGSYGQACVCFPGEKTLTKLYAGAEEQKHATNVYTVATVASMQVALADKVLSGKTEEVKNGLFLLDYDSFEIKKVTL